MSLSMVGEWKAVRYYGITMGDAESFDGTELLKNGSYYSVFNFYENVTMKWSYGYAEGESFSNLFTLDFDDNNKNLFKAQNPYVAGDITFEILKLDGSNLHLRLWDRIVYECIRVRD